MMLPVNLTDKILPPYSEDKSNTIETEQEINPDILISPILTVERDEDYVFGMFFMTLFLFVWILFMFVYPFMLEEDSTLDEDEEEIANESIASNNETDIDIEGEYDDIVNQIQMHKSGDKEDLKNDISI